MDYVQHLYLYVKQYMGFLKKKCVFLHLQIKPAQAVQFMIQAIQLKNTRSKLI